MRFNTADMVKRDNLVISIIKKYKCRNNPVSSKEIAKALEEKGFKSNARCISTIVSRLMYERNLPIGFVNSRGYYWATCEDDITPCISDLEGRIAEMQKHIDHLKSFIIRRNEK